MTTVALYFFWFFLPLQPLQIHGQREKEVCRGATFFIKHGSVASWTKKKKLLCHIGKHDFYGDL